MKNPLLVSDRTHVLHAYKNNKIKAIIILKKLNELRFHTVGLMATEANS